MPSISIPHHITRRQSSQTKKPKSPINKSCIVRSILDLCSHGRIHEALTQLDFLPRLGLCLDSKTIATILKRCGDEGALREGKWVHRHLRLTGRKDPGVLVSNHLIYMYMSCGEVRCARKVFDKMPVRNLYSWNNVVSGYAKRGLMEKARGVFERMGERDVVSWNSMVIGYAQSGEYEAALRYYKGLRREGGVGLNAFSFSGALMVGVKLKDLGLTRQVQCQVLGFGYQGNVVLSSSILDAYCKCGEMGDARKVFNEMSIRDAFTWSTLISGFAKLGDMGSAKELFDMMPDKNAVAWTSVISGYARNGLAHHALELFRKMILLRYTPDQYTFSSCLAACATIASLKHGKQIHAHLILSGFRSNMIVLSSLIDMYSKCGRLEYCRRVFAFTDSKQEVMLWNPMIAALAQHGYGKEAVELFDEMVNCGVKPNRVSYVIILNACSHSCLLDTGRAFFKSMTEDHGLIPDIEHYACLIDLLGRAGHFDELIHELDKMPCKTDHRIWNALLGVCSIHGNEELGSKAAHRVLEMEPQSSGAYSLLSSVYAASGNWVSVEEVRQLMHERKSARKEQAGSWTETDSKSQALFSST
ncbi:hypothetical protein Droror1_Dr00007085 [Drosera rotundifolia]